ncbi:MAG: hypothetical protein JST86_18555 [Bacteroidetes bacterium]|nr:hypothetical protein [Bacteroidota bacterium]
MKKRLRIFFLAAAIFFIGFGSSAQTKREIIYIQTLPQQSARVKFGIEKLQQTLSQKGYDVVINENSSEDFTHTSIFISINKKGNEVNKSQSVSKEAYHITSAVDNIKIEGTDATGILYGCIKLADIINTTGKLPRKIDITDAPEMVLRGECIGLQKSTYLPGRNVYEYPYTPETFPWFYDKKLWVQVLDSMLTNRMNSLYLWNGHPFASLVKLKDYPYAVEVDDSTFKKNEDIYRFITTEADKRGIWVIQMFYNIIVSKPFAEYHHIKTQDRERHIIPVIADYTRKSIAAFVEKYPNVGLMVCLGEAMEGVGKDDIEWFTKTIIPGVKDGLKALGKNEEPPIVLRAHDTDAPAVMEAALPLYKNLYTEAKFNGEALTDPRPRGEWAKLHQTLSRLGSVQIENVHIMANLEPFRYGSPDFIQQSVIGMHEVMGGNGLHLYPQASYWDWPYSADSVKGKKLLQIERDWIWYKAWSRYAWKANRSRDEEIVYWSQLLAQHFGCSREDGKGIMEAYDASGQIAPKLLRRFGITDGNRQTLTLGMLMTQLINPYRFGLFTLLYDSESPEGEMLTQYAEKEWKGEKHIGETPVQIINEVKQDGDAALKAISKIKSVTKNREEFARLVNDMRCYKALAYHYADKAAAALQVLRYKYSDAVPDLEKAIPLLQQSVNDYKELTALTAATYRYANSMQTQQRKIPMRGANATFKHWTELLPVYENEFNLFRHKVDSLKSVQHIVVNETKPFQNAACSIEGNAHYVIEKGATVFSDSAFIVENFANELKGVQGVRLSYQQQVKEETVIHFTCNEPVKILVGYFKPQRAAFSKDTVFAKEPELETNASANDYGQAEIKIAHALVIKGLPPVNIHTYSFAAGQQTLTLPKGVCLVLGIINDKENIPVYDAGLTKNGITKELDWLFE